MVARDPYERMCGDFFADFTDRNVSSMFQEADKGDQRSLYKILIHHRIQQLSKSALLRVQCRLINVLVCSPDIHCIENVFHIANNMP